MYLLSYKLLVTTVTWGCALRRTHWVLRGITVKCEWHKVGCGMEMLLKPGGLWPPGCLATYIALCCPATDIRPVSRHPSCHRASVLSSGTPPVVGYSSYLNRTETLLPSWHCLVVALGCCWRILCTMVQSCDVIACPGMRL